MAVQPCGALAGSLPEAPAYTAQRRNSEEPASKSRFRPSDGSRLRGGVPSCRGS